MNAFLWLLHGVFIHPIAAVLWFTGTFLPVADRWGHWVHDKLQPYDDSAK